MHSKDASYYTDKISSLEWEQIEFLKHLKEQITIIKSIIQSMNSTLTEVSKNERILSEDLEKIAKHMNEHDTEVKGCLLLCPCYSL